VFFIPLIELELFKAVNCAQPITRATCISDAIQLSGRLVLKLSVIGKKLELASVYRYNSFQQKVTISPKQVTLY